MARLNPHTDDRKGGRKKNGRGALPPKAARRTAPPSGTKTGHSRSGAVSKSRPSSRRTRRGGKSCRLALLRCRFVCHRPCDGHRWRVFGEVTRRGKGNVKGDW